jgi:O-antigen/teichoic acid export membrane protein
MLSKLHAKLGDFWWYSLMLFCACRAADLLNAFVGLWLVPKYVDTKELGAVMPLTQFAGFLALPVGIFAMTFMKEMTGLATRGEYGKMKSLMRGVFIGAGIFLVLALVISRMALPAFLERIRIAEGSLGFLVVASAFISTVAPVYQNTLQALKRFKTISVLNIIGAPIRLVAMVVTMPFRALSGYFVGQAAPPAFTIVASVYALRKELAVPAVPYWSRSVFRHFLALLIGMAAYQMSSGFLSLVEQTALRQRLPEIESAAYYMTTRFSDIASFVCGTLTMVLFPFTASLAAEGKPTRPLVVKSSLAMLTTGGLLAIAFALAGKPLLSVLPNGDQYANYAWAIPWLIGITSLSAIQTFHTNTEASAGRFGFLKWWVPLHAVFAAGLLAITGYGYFTDYIPPTWQEFLATHNFTSLKAMLVWFTATTLLRTAISLYELMRQPSTHGQGEDNGVPA